MKLPMPIAAGAVAAAWLVVPWAVPLARCDDSSRAESLGKYFQGLKSPLAAHVDDFIEAADRFGLDWRLLPALAVVETGAGRVARNHNHFGWGRQRFDSTRAAILHVAEQLAESPRYRGKSTRDKLVAYNRLWARTFPARVERVMNKIGSAALH